MITDQLKIKDRIKIELKTCCSPKLSVILVLIKEIFPFL